MPAQGTLELDQKHQMMNELVRQSNQGRLIHYSRTKNPGRMRTTPDEEMAL